jgi:hypothetical protein
MIMKKITSKKMVKKTIWSVVPTDYKSIKQGKKFVLVNSPKGTTMVGVNHPMARKQWGKYLKK